MLTLNLPAKLSNILCAELEMAGQTEIGGILMGKQLAPDHFEILELTIQRNGGSFATFIRNATSALRSLKIFFKKTEHTYSTFNYLGEWHSHPSFTLNPSQTDHNSMTEMACDVNVGANFIVLLIVKLKNNRTLDSALTIYLPCLLYTSPSPRDRG